MMQVMPLERVEFVQNQDVCGAFGSSLRVGDKDIERLTLVADWYVVVDAKDRGSELVPYHQIKRMIPALDNDVPVVAAEEWQIQFAPEYEETSQAAAPKRRSRKSKPAE